VTVLSDVCVSEFLTSLCKLGPEVAMTESHTTDRAVETPAAPFTILLTPPPHTQFVDCTNPLASRSTQSESRTSLRTQHQGSGGLKQAERSCELHYGSSGG
jgi:hypothetical protein